MICNLGVTGSNPVGGSKANVAQLVEHNLAKVGVVSSNLIIRSTASQAMVRSSRGEDTTLSRLRHGFDSRTDYTISRVGLEMAPARSHKPNDGGSNPSPATKLL